MTALGNDYAYEDIFLRQLQNFARSKDVVMVLSVSGNSPNLVKAVEWSIQHGVSTIALVGARRGRLAETWGVQNSIQDQALLRARG